MLLTVGPKFFRVAWQALAQNMDSVRLEFGVEGVSRRSVNYVESPEEVLWLSRYRIQANIPGRSF